MKQIEAAFFTMPFGLAFAQSYPPHPKNTTPPTARAVHFPPNLGTNTPRPGKNQQTVKSKT